MSFGAGLACGMGAGFGSGFASGIGAGNGKEPQAWFLSSHWRSSSTGERLEVTRLDGRPPAGRPRTGASGC